MATTTKTTTAKTDTTAKPETASKSTAANGPEGFDMSPIMAPMKETAAVGEKLAHVALEAAERSSELSSAWTRDMLASLGTVATVRDDPADYAAVMADFASTQSELAARNISAFAGIAQAMQEQTLGILGAAGQRFGGDAATAMHSAAGAMTRAARPMMAR